MQRKDLIEITFKVPYSKEKIVTILKEHGFNCVGNYRLDDYYMIPSDLDIQNSSPREIVAKSVIVRHIEHSDGRDENYITTKEKIINDKDEIVFQRITNFETYNIEDAKILLETLGYMEIINIKENGESYGNEELDIAIKDVEGLGIIIEIENNGQYKNIDELKELVERLEFPVENNDFFVKKAEKLLIKKIERS